MNLKNPVTDARFFLLMVIGLITMGKEPDFFIRLLSAFLFALILFYIGNLVYNVVQSIIARCKKLW